MHRHSTLRYRMKRVEEITGRDLDQSQDDIRVGSPPSRPRSSIDQPGRDGLAPKPARGNHMPNNQDSHRSLPRSGCRTHRSARVTATRRSTAALAAARSVAARCSVLARSAPRHRRARVCAQGELLDQVNMGRLAAPCAAKVAQAAVLDSREATITPPDRAACAVAPPARQNTAGGAGAENPLATKSYPRLRGTSCGRVPGTKVRWRRRRGRRGRARRPSRDPGSCPVRTARIAGHGRRGRRPAGTQRRRLPAAAP